LVEEPPLTHSFLTSKKQTKKAGGIVLPTYASYDNIWCGGSDVKLNIPQNLGDLDLSGYFQVGVTYSIDDLTVHSSACSFQGN